MTRREKLLIKIQPRLSKGLEIGPLDRPIVTKEMGKIFYVDHATTDEIKQKCKVWSDIDVNKIENVDYIWGEINLKDIAKDNCPFDYVIASHVIEHVPDLIGWFKEVRSVLVSGGILSLAIPDKRFSFDYLRQISKPGEVLEAYTLKSRKPSVKQIFDAKSEFVHRHKKYKQFGFSENLVHEHTLKESWQIAKNAFDHNKYEDVHCWVFTEYSFVELLKTLAHLELFDFKISEFFKRSGHEFFISLEAINDFIEGNDKIQIQLSSIKKFQERISSPLSKIFHDYDSWKVLNLFRSMKTKFTRNE